MNNLPLSGIIAAVRTDSEFNKAVLSDSDAVFDLSPDLLTVIKKVKIAHEAGKKIFIHLDLATGIGKDKSGTMFAKRAGVDGIISTRVNIIKNARECGLFTVQRFFIVDSQSVDTTIEAVKASKPDMIEIMPGVVFKVIGDLKKHLDVPIIAGGLIKTKQEADEAVNYGASAVSTGTENLWNKEKTV